MTKSANSDIFARNFLSLLSSLLPRHVSAVITSDKICCRHCCQDMSQRCHHSRHYCQDMSARCHHIRQNRQHLQVYFTANPARDAIKVTVKIVSKNLCQLCQHCQHCHVMSLPRIPSGLCSSSFAQIATISAIPRCCQCHLNLLILYL